MGAPLPLHWFAHAFGNAKRRYHQFSGAREEHGLAQGADAGAGAKPRGAITEIWHRLKALASRRGDQDALATKQPTLAVRVRFMGDLPSLTGQRNLLVTLPEGATVGELFESLSGTYGEVFTSRVFRGPAKLQHAMLVFVDGENINELGGLAAKLGNSEVEVIMLPIIEGG